MRITILSLFMFCFISAYSIYFEGEVSYQIDITATKKKTDSHKIDMLYGIYGHSFTWFISGGQYKKVLKGSDVIEEVIYLPMNHSLNEYTVKAQKYQKKDASKDPGTLKLLPHKNDKITVKDFECRRVDFEGKDFKLEVYYSSKLKMDYKAFKDHKADYLDEILKKIKAVPLKMVYKYDDLNVVIRCTDVKRHTVEMKTFTFKKASESLQSGVKNDHEKVSIYNSDSTYSVDLMSWMKPSNEDSYVTNVEIQYQNDYKHLYMMVISKSVEDLKAKGENFNDYVDFVERNFINNVKNPSMREIASKPANGMDVKYFELVGDYDEELSFFYQIGVIKGEKNYYQVVTWTFKDNKGPLVPLMREIILSIKEY